ncbi:hypothetical protein [Ferruginibacter sp.]|nr:hypothetical protein [Ferruginibacter sp.]
MGRNIFTLIALFTLSVLHSQGQTLQDSILNNKQKVDKPIKVSDTHTPIYQLYPTENSWASIKLDTRNGKLWQVHFSISNDNFEGVLSINLNSLVKPEEEIAGRFTLYPTKNIYNFILLDQIDGRTFKVQWNNDSDKRFIREIY